MKSLNFDSGYEEIMINGDENKVIRLNMGDFNLVKRLEDMSRKIGEMSPEVNGADMDSEKAYEVDQQLKSMLDEALNAQVSAIVFGETSCLALNSSGVPIMKAFLNSLIAMINERNQTVKPSVRKELTDKYTEPVVSKPQYTVPKPGMTKEQIDAAFAEYLRQIGAANVTGLRRNAL